LISKTSLSHISLREVKAPISGKIIDIRTTKGIAVKEGQVLMILEAMKMEIINKIVEEVKVSKGQSVKTGDILISFD
jgi:biotin carboxyl carrier protein